MEIKMAERTLSINKRVVEYNDNQFLYLLSSKGKCATGQNWIWMIFIVTIRDRS